jgi:hypothetical protein
MNRLHRTAVAVGVAIATLLTGAVAVATGPKFLSEEPPFVSDTGALVVNFDERGLGNDDVEFRLTAVGTALYACVNGGGNISQTATIVGAVIVTGFFVPKNGRIVASLTAGPPEAPESTCPSGQDRVLAAVTYTNIELTDTTNAVSIAEPDASRIFIEI